MFNLWKWFKGDKSCYNRPKNIKLRVMGKCHVCGKLRSIGFCPICCHWFCRECSISSDRVLAAFKAKFGSAKDGCCGGVGGVEGVRLQDLNMNEKGG